MLRTSMPSPRGRARKPVLAPLDALALRFRLRIARARRQLGTGLVLLALVASAHVARQGTAPLRIAGVLLLLLSLVLLVLVIAHARRTLTDRRRLISATLQRVDAGVSARALRALSLVERVEVGTARESGESSELSQLHFQRVLTQVPTERLDAWAARVADRTRLWLLLVVVAAGAALAFDPDRVFEGLNVMLARGGRAPVPMQWLGSVQIESRPPAYLRGQDHSLISDSAAYEPVGSLIVFQGVPEREGRTLVLLGGEREVPFVSDGAGGVVARWVLSKPVELRVAARFGDVLITEAQALAVRAVADEAPIVELEGAPRRVELKDLQALELRYDARDDHGLREVALVLRAGGREDRRTLERLDGIAKQRAGAQALSPRDAVLRRSFLPVEVTIEARDNDAVSGAKWGASGSVTVVPPGIGEGEAARYAALKAVRLSLTQAYARAQRDALEASREGLRSSPPGAAKKAQAEQIKTALDPLRTFVESSYTGLAVPQPLRAFLLGQARALERPAATRETFLRRLEDVLLAVDAALRATGNRDAESVAKRLGDVADEVAEGCKLGLDPEKRALASRRLQTALPVLAQGSDALLSLSSLGADLGSVAHGELRRIQRGLDAHSYAEAELAARHLAARLHRPKPSFSSAGGGGVEGGERGRNRSKPPGEASQAHKQFQELMRQLEQLASEHAGELGSVERTLEAAERSEQDPDLLREAKERAEALRRAFQELPDYTAGQSKREQAAALAREHGRAMAEGLSRLSLKDAKRSADDAQQQLNIAKSRTDGGGPPQQALERAEQELSRQRAWLEDLLEKALEREGERAKQALKESGEREHGLAERAQNISGRGSHGEAALPEEVARALDRAEGLMREAARELSSGRGAKGLALQREAQRLLEQQGDESNSEHSEPEPQQGEPQSAQGPDTGSTGRAQNTDVPGRDKGEKALRFRQRVLDGLARDKGGRLGPAVKRYAEGLLQ